LSYVLEASVSKPIEILNKDLGYIIYYDLIHFELTPDRISYLGYIRYKKIKGSKRKQRKWKKNRLRAYHGSQMHFIRAARNNTLSQEGFVIDQSKRVPNPERPSDEVIKETRKYLRTLNTGKYSSGAFSISSRDGVTIETSKNKSVKTTGKGSSIRKKRDSAMAIIRKGRLKKFTDVLLRKNLTESDFIVRSGNSILMKFQYHLKIKYLKEAEEYNYRRGPNRLEHQASTLSLFTEGVLLDKSGVFVEPLDVFVEGYWSYEKTADILPLDYDPKD
jgi:hypothetical protein